MRQRFVRVVGLLASLAALTQAQTYSCPANNAQNVTDSNGYGYVLGCYDDTSGGNFNVSSTTNGFNDCFLGCDNSTLYPGCTAWTWVASGAGGGAGSCFYKNFASETFTNGDANHVAAIRRANYAGNDTTPPVVTTTSSSSQAPAPSTPPQNIPPSNTFTCPADNDTLVTDSNGVQYIIGP